MTSHTQSRTATMILLALIGSIASFPYTTEAAGETRLELMPHCIETNRTKCPTFAVLDAERVTTGKLKAGDLLDLDIVLRSGEPASIREIRSWLSYDATILESRSVELSTVITNPTPGEQEADAKNGLVKVGGSTPAGVTGDNVLIARVTFRIVQATKDTTIAFYRYLPSGIGQTAVNAEGHPAADIYEEDFELAPAPCFDEMVGCKGTSRTPLLLGKPADLFVSLADAAAASTVSASTSSAASTPTYAPQTAASVSSTALQTQGQTSSTSAMTGALSSSSTGLDSAPSPFSLLQVQGVEVTTRETSVYLGWQTLKSSELAGYNIYYGTVSGRYIQRRSVTPLSVSAVLRDFEPDTTYYFAIRAFNQRNEEGMFSREVAVTVGKPETATVPFLRSGVDSGKRENVVTNNGGSSVSGETGTATTLVWLLIVAALIGTAFAFKRQLSLSHVS